MPTESNCLHTDCWQLPEAPGPHKRLWPPHMAIKRDLAATNHHTRSGDGHTPHRCEPHSASSMFQPVTSTAHRAPPCAGQPSRTYRQLRQGHRRDYPACNRVCTGEFRLQDYLPATRVLASGNIDAIPTARPASVHSNSTSVRASKTSNSIWVA